MTDLPEDFVDLLTAFASSRVRYLVVGGYAVGFHGRPRTTKDLHVLLDSSADNRVRACETLKDFGAPESVIRDVRTADRDEIVWWGHPPLRIDLLPSIPGVVFDEAHKRRLRVHVSGIDVDVLSLEDLIRAKRASGRDQDLVDARRLEALRAK